MCKGVIHRLIKRCPAKSMMQARAHVVKLEHLAALWHPMPADQIGLDGIKEFMRERP